MSLTLMGQPPGAITPLARSGRLFMGVSDRMANDGLLYEGWGAEGMKTLNTTASFQAEAEGRGISRYDTVLLVSARAKENAYQSAEEDGPGYIGSSFGGPMGAGMRKPLPAKSQVVTAIEELLTEVEETGSLPQLLTPGIPEGWEAAQAAQVEAFEAAHAAQAEAEAQGLGDEAAAEAAAAAAAAVAARVAGMRDDDAEVDGESDDAIGDGDDLAAMLTDDTFDDDLDLDGDDDIAELFSGAGGEGDDSIEASGMSPGDRG